MGKERRGVFVGSSTGSNPVREKAIFKSLERRGMPTRRLG